MRPRPVNGFGHYSILFLLAFPSFRVLRKCIVQCPRRSNHFALAEDSVHFADSNSTFFGARSSLAIRKPRILLSTGSAITSLPTIRPEPLVRYEHQRVIPSELSKPCAGR